MLAYDIARCHGHKETAGGLWAGCVDCLRRTSPGNPERQVYTSPQVRFNLGSENANRRCDARIPPDTKRAA